MILTTTPKFRLIVVLLLFILSNSFSQDKTYDAIKGAEIYVYKAVDDFDLKINVFKPVESKKEKKYPAIIFFFGGGWNGGNVHQFEQHCKLLASKGMVAMAANYRVKSRNNSTPFDAVEDAKSAIRWIRENASELGVNKNKIVAAGGSAGGHLAASSAIIPGFEGDNENKNISSKPHALVLFNPVINTTKEGYGSERLGDKAETISPAHHVVPKLPPTLIFHGTNDKTVPFSNVTDFQSKMEDARNICYVVPFEGQGHGFFNFGRSENKYYELTTEKMVSFLMEMRYIK